MILVFLLFFVVTVHRGGVTTNQSLSHEGAASFLREDGKIR